jgi:1-acyl-sn-glycerol-3-phosphate acyltransferase
MTMKKILRIFLMGLFLIPTFPFFFYKTYGNKKIILKPNTILISNHYSNFDPFFIQMRFLFKDIRFVTLRDVKKKLHLRFIAWLFNAVYVDPSRADVTFFKEAMSALKNGSILCIFPEGVVNPRKFGFFDFKMGYIKLAFKANSTIVPIYLYPALKAFKRSKIHILNAIEISCTTLEPSDLNAKIQSDIMEVSSSY